ncbi:gibberellin 2-beta-dioxygenase 2-like [Phalaenopsis equestris]|uniref:gibberellin 2-beta-dioxygenase 2-like n=1 Tax=Phalaenopsis equestris TaxID=78828 RepID=UPI0009E2B6E9|nr:gibberellin 2-beta-dioxygenase 2-like [Phalaenopsis equestris]
MVTANMIQANKQRMVSSDLPVIDLSGKRETVRKLMVNACEEFGFFKVINHGVPGEIIDNVEKESKEFFSLAASEKQKAGPPNPLGYGSKKIGSNGDTGDLEFLLFHADPTSIYEIVRKVSSNDSNKFSCVLSEYVKMIRELACDILELLGEGLELEDKKFFSKLLMDSENDSLIRLNHYPSYDSSADQGLTIIKNKDDKGSRVGFGEHSDPQILTILRSNNVEGLQIQSPLDGNLWIPVKSDSSAFFINVGDALQAMTNGRFVSVRHRAMVTAQKSRLSTMFFAAPSLQSCISPLPEMVTHENPPRYRPFTWAEYKKTMYSLRLATNRLELFKSDC